MAYPPSGPRPVRETYETYDQWVDRLRSWRQVNRNFTTDLKRQAFEGIFDMIRSQSTGRKGT